MLSRQKTSVADFLIWSHNIIQANDANSFTEVIITPWLVLWLVSFKFSHESGSDEWFTFVSSPYSVLQSTHVGNTLIFVPPGHFIHDLS